MTGGARLALTAIGALSIALAGCGFGRVAPSPDDLSGWQPRPLPADASLAQIATTSAGCTAGQPAGAAVQIVLQDRRTPSSAAFLVAGPGFSGSCLVTNAGGASGGSGRSAPLDPLAGAIAVDEQSTGGLATATATLLGGRVREDVTSVDVQLPDGRTVAASLGGGHWLAWWPGDSTATQVVARDASGAALATLTDTTPGFEVKPT